MTESIIVMMLLFLTGATGLAIGLIGGVFMSRRTVVGVPATNVAGTQTLI